MSQFRPGQIWKSNIYGGHRLITETVGDQVTYTIDGIVMTRDAEWFKKWMGHQLTHAAEWPTGWGV